MESLIDANRSTANPPSTLFLSLDFEMLGDLYEPDGKTPKTPSRENTVYVNYGMTNHFGWQFQVYDANKSAWHDLPLSLVWNGQVPKGVFVYLKDEQQNKKPTREETFTYAQNVLPAEQIWKHYDVAGDKGWRIQYLLVAEPGDGNHTAGGGNQPGPGDGNHTADVGQPGDGDGNHTAGGGHHQPGPADANRTPEEEAVPLTEVEEFVQAWLADKAHYAGSRVLQARKMNDYATQGAYVYQVSLDQGTDLYFDQNQTFLHSSPSDRFAHKETKELSETEYPESVKAAVLAAHPGATLDEVEMEYSSEPSADGNRSFVYLAIIKKGEEELELVLNKNGKVLHTHRHEESDFERNEWKEAKLPDSAVTHLRQNYKDGEAEIGYWIEERKKGDGSTEYVAHLHDEREIVFDANGSFRSERDPWKERAQQLTAGLKFVPKLSSWGQGASFSTDTASGKAVTGGQAKNAFVHVRQLENDANDTNDGAPSMLYRIALLNRAVNDGNVSTADFDLNGTDLPAGTRLNLTFSYQMGPPRYFVVSGAKLTGFKHRRPEWDKPGSFTIQAETTDPVTSDSNSPDTVSSAFGLLVEMGGERFHEGAVFVTNVVPSDVKAPGLSSPWDAVTGFHLAGQAEANASVQAFLPRRLVQERFAIWNPADVKAAIARADGSLSYVGGSRTQGGGEGDVGGQFNRTPYKGYEPHARGGAGAETFKVADDVEFGPAHQGGEGAGTTGQPGPANGETQQGQGGAQPNADGTAQTADDNVSNSFIDFDGDGFVDSMLAVSFVNASWPGEVQIGEPFLDPFASVDVNAFGKISGTVKDGDGKPLRDFGIWIGKAPEGNATIRRDKIYESEPVFYNLKHEGNGSYVAELGPGRYLVEAHAYDPETDTPYKPQIAGGYDNPSVITIADANTSVTLDFTLKAEYRRSRETGEVKGVIEVADGSKPEGVAIELFPIDDNGTLLSTEPAHVLFVEPNGKIRGKAPVGSFQGEVVSWDNAYLDKSVTVIVAAGQTTDLGDVDLTKRGLATVTGSIKDADGKGSPAEILFVDPEEKDEVFWPAELTFAHDANGTPTGAFTAKVPAGSYKIRAERFDGSLLPAYYLAGNVAGASDFSAGTTVEVNATGLTGVDFVLQARPTATVTLQVLDANTSAPVKYAWFDLQHAEDENGEVRFPHVRTVKPFEATDFNGSYVLKVPGGTYKLLIGADGYEEAYRTLDESGNVAWSGVEWSQAASVTLTDGNATDLGKATLTAYATNEAERFGFKWMLDDGAAEPGAPALPAGSSVKGQVATSDGTSVPKARLIAHTEDYLLWIDQYESRSDGSFELKNLPPGRWVVQAEPPFDSETFRGFRPSAQHKLTLPADENKSVSLVLTGANVSGRVLFPKRDHKTGSTKDEALGNAFVWAFRDEDGDGEPDSDENATNAVGTAGGSFTEVFGETDKKGYFSFYLPEAGKYSLVLDLPGRLAALSPEPIAFSLQNPKKELKLGNAIRLDWKSTVKATAFDVERKGSKDSSYRSLFSSDSDKPSSKDTHHVDVSITPGETYEYRVIAETAKGRVTLDSDSVRTSNPLVYLAPPKKTLSGIVLDDNGSAVSGAEVVAWREAGEGWSSTFTGSDGKYELVTGPGKWEATVYRPHGQKVDWTYDQAPKRVSFTKDATKESKTLNFQVKTASGGKITGQIKLPAGQTSWSAIKDSVSIDAFSPDGRGNWGAPDDNGSFEIPLQPGEYKLSIWVDPAKLKGVGAPPERIVRVGKNEVKIGMLELATRSSAIKGTLSTSDGTALANVEVYAWSEKGGWASDVTNVNGAYSISVGPGLWEVGYEIPQTEGRESPYLPNPPKRVKVKEGQTKTVGFTARKAEATVTGSVYAPGGKPVSGLDAWVYATAPTTKPGSHSDVLAEVPLTSRGQFTFPAKPGSYVLGLWLPPGSGYVLPAEKTVTVTTQDVNGTTSTVLKDANGSTLSELSFQLEANDAIVAGSLKLNGAALSGLTGEVFAVKGDDGTWQSASIETNGTYSLTLSPGRWTLDYYVESDSDTSRKLPVSAPEPIAIVAKKGQTVSQDFSLVNASATIKGTVADDANATLSGKTVYVWAERRGTSTLAAYRAEAELEDNGTYSLTVLPGGEYRVGAFLSEELREAKYLEPKVTSADLSSGNVSDLRLQLGKLSEANYVSGVIRDANGSALSGAFVYAYTDDGLEVSGETDANGSYKLTVTKGAVWKVGAEYSSFDDNGTETLYLADVDMDADLRSADSADANVTLKTPDFELPEAGGGTFDPTKDYVTTLPDGTVVTIPAGAANVSSDVTSVRLVVTPVGKGLAKSAEAQPTSYGYSLELFDSSGKKVEGNFKKDVILKIPVDRNATIAKGLDPNNVQAKYYSSTKNTWDVLKSSNYDENASVIYATTNHFTNVAATSSSDVSVLATGLTKVDASASGDWYNLSWLGYFYDAASGWVYHETHGWLYPQDGSGGNFWFYDADLGWFWTGPSYYDKANSKYYLYSSTHAGWLYFSTDTSGKRKFYRYSDSKWINADGTAYSQ